MNILLAALLAGLTSFIMTPFVKRFAISVDAVDKPGERRVNVTEIPRMGGIAIFCGFMLAVVIFVDVTTQVQGILFGAIIIALMGALDDIYNLKPLIKLAAQIAAAMVCIKFGVVVNGVSAILDSETVYVSNFISYSLTVLWIVMSTNATNLIDGLDGLSCGISGISALTLLVISLMVSDMNVSVMLACLLGACIGFLPYNWNPAKIFMGDVGSQLLGFLLSTISMLGLFKMHAAVTLLVPMLAMSVPIADTCFAFIRRIARGQSPFHADKGHFHHRLLALGFSQKQVVIVLYGISVFMGIIAIMMTGVSGILKIFGFTAAFLIALVLVLYVTKFSPAAKQEQKKSNVDGDEDVKIYEKGEKK